ncbi:hypothetical protein G3N56_08325 [Desulfovibrio sulfodismutans]|uniref:Uncharacterized protein n=1 Tax=Desulfolutivibrio sulfodismutans TaxID=63561 RepID=A0A7K3NNH5_9BACT|nr:hypothetical protein [Desulfolutivibrio sulfodismutans]NDY56749.1 hypothetical protein [Desulfolutivibrio sulfodismutans]QLA13293.1 hypothetical protein GD606_13995 [Desulfolutivibrio sulfodismutans DSM 3696]
MSVKLVEGQLEFLKDVAKLSELSDSIASQSLRTYVKTLEQTQAVAPDVIPCTVSVKSTIESDTGRVVDDIS